MTPLKNKIPKVKFYTWDLFFTGVKVHRVGTVKGMGLFKFEVAILKVHIVN